MKGSEYRMETGLEELVLKGTEYRMESRSERAWWRLYTTIKWLADLGIQIEPSSVLYIMDRFAQDEHLRKGVERRERVGATREEVLQ